MIAFITEHKDHRVGDGLRWGVEPLCAVLTEHGIPISPSTYYEWVTRRPSARALRDEQVTELIRAERESSRLVAGLGSRKMWLRLRGKGHDVARCTVERLYRANGWEGAQYGRKPRTTIPDERATRAADLVNRDFDPVAPNRLWVADFTYVPTWLGMVYVAFVIDAFSRRVIGWRAATSMTTPLVLDALEHALFTRAQEGVTDLTGLVAHSDAGNTPRSPSPPGCSRPASTPRSAPSATPTTTPWPSPRSARSRPSRSTEMVPGGTSTTSRSPRSSGSTSSTPSGRTTPSTTSPRPSSSRSTTLTEPPSPRQGETHHRVSGHSGAAHYAAWRTQVDVEIQRRAATN